MHFAEFQHLARLSAVGKLDPDELARLEAGRRQFGPEAEACLREAQNLPLALALSLPPVAPQPWVKRCLMERIAHGQRAVAVL